MPALTSTWYPTPATSSTADSSVALQNQPAQKRDHVPTLASTPRRCTPLAPRMTDGDGERVGGVGRG